MNKKKQLVSKMAFVAVSLLLLGLSVGYKLVYLQLVEGEKYEKLSEKTTVKNFEITPIRGNIYALDGSLLATSVPRYSIYFDAVTVKNSTFKKYINPLSDSLSVLFGKPSNHYRDLLIRARNQKNRYKRLARDLSYEQMNRLRTFPMFRLGGVKGGLIVERKTVREHPLGKIAERTIGYEQRQPNGQYLRVGLEGAYGNRLRGVPGLQLRQKIANGEWKPLTNSYQQEPQDGYDVFTTIDVNIQDITHHALLKALEDYEAEHGTAIVMETKTGAIRAVANLGRTQEGKYYEKLNYAIGESHEPGSTFKLMALVAALEDKVVDTTTVIDTKNGILTFYGKYNVRDSKKGGYGKISLAEVFERSSNTGMVQAIHENYKSRPELFVNRLINMGLSEPLGIPVLGEGIPKIPHPKDADWDGLDLPWMAYGYGVSLTPLQTLTFYNAVANNGVMVKPRFVDQIRSLGDYRAEKLPVGVLNASICSEETLSKVQALLKGVVEKPWGTARNIYDPEFAISGKTGTCQVDYTKDEVQYVSSFVGYFPSDKPKYSCIVVVHRPNKKKGYYGNRVAAPVFKTIAHKLYSTIPENQQLDIERLQKLTSVEKDLPLDTSTPLTQTQP